MGEAADIRQRLAAILAADAAGYSRLMTRDERATVAALDAARDHFRTAIETNNGRVVDTAGDSVLAVFETAVGAVSAALDVQRVLVSNSTDVPEDRRMRFRVGVHLGDVIEKPDGSVYGDGVNIAARLQALALPGGITVSEAIRGSVQNRVRATFEDLGQQEVKNIADPVHAFRMHPENAPGVAKGVSPRPTPGRAAATHVNAERSPLTSISPARGHLRMLARRWMFAALAAIALGAASVVWWMRSPPVSAAANSKSIAVLPFVDMSEKHDQEYFSDGLSEELIDHLTHAADLKVIARTSSFQFKGKNEDMRLIAQRLGVAHLLEGSVRKSGDALRITAQLIRADDGVHIWSQTYDRDLNDIFTVQDEIARTVAKALQVALHTEGARSESRPSNTQAYNLLLEGDFFINRSTKADTEKAIEIYKQAIQLDSNYARAWARLADAYGFLGFFGLAKVAEQHEAIDHALRIDPNLADAHGARGFMLKYYDWDWQGAEAEFRRAGELNPDHPVDGPLASIGWMFGRLDESIEAHRRKLERDPLSTNSLWGLGLDLFMAGRYEEATSAFRKVSELNPSYASAKAFLGLALMFQGKKAEALTAVEQEPDASWKSNFLPMVYWDLGRRADSDAALTHLEQTYADSGAYQIVEVHAYRGEIDVAFDWLEKAYRQRDPGTTWVKVDPLLRNLHGDPRYKAFLVKLKLDGDGPRQ